MNKKSDLETSPGKKVYGGLNRLAYSGIVIVVSQFDPMTPNLWLNFWIACIIVFVVWLATIFRLRNIGFSQWWSLLVLVPIPNIVIFLMCFALPKGYRDTRRFDLAGKIILGVVGTLFLLAIGTALVQLFVLL